MKVYISSDHGGFNYKQILITYLKELGYDVVDLGPDKLDPADDYPQFAKALALAVIKEDVKGILVCRNGVGVSVVANKFPGIRCALCFNTKHATSTRNDDNANVLSLPADYISLEEAKDISKTFLETPFGPHDRYQRRFDEIKQIEKELTHG